jgi:hypothetical protein
MARHMIIIWVSTGSALSGIHFSLEPSDNRIIPGLNAIFPRSFPRPQDPCREKVTSKIIKIDMMTTHLFFPCQDHEKFKGTPYLTIMSRTSEAFLLCCALVTLSARAQTLHSEIVLALASLPPLKGAAECHAMPNAFQSLGDDAHLNGKFQQGCPVRNYCENCDNGNIES